MKHIIFLKRDNRIFNIKEVETSNEAKEYANEFETVMKDCKAEIHVQNFDPPTREGLKIKAINEASKFLETAFKFYSDFWANVPDGSDILLAGGGLKKKFTMPEFNYNQFEDKILGDMFSGLTWKAKEFVRRQCYTEINNMGLLVKVNVECGFFVSDMPQNSHLTYDYDLRQYSNKYAVVLKMDNGIIKGRETLEPFIELNEANERIKAENTIKLMNEYKKAAELVNWELHDVFNIKRVVN